MKVAKTMPMVWIGEVKQKEDNLAEEKQSELGFRDFEREARFP